MAGCVHHLPKKYLFKLKLWKVPYCNVLKLADDFQFKLNRTANVLYKTFRGCF